MREIRFRAWDRKRKEMFIVHEIHFDKISGVITYVSGYGETDKDGTAFYGGGERGYAKALRYVLQEFTGLRDKNGKEIYEGDVLQSVGLNGNKEISLVYWSKNSLRWQTDFKSQCLNLAISTWLEIVGNVYENPELLNEKEETE